MADPIEVEMEIEIEGRKFNAELYNALSEGYDDKVYEMCQSMEDGPCHILTIHGDSLLHVASYYKRNHLVLQLMNMIPLAESNKLTLQNKAGDTILHSTATNNKTVEAAKEILHRAPSLLTMTDNLGETALFRAARYGKTQIFHFLEEYVTRLFPAREALKAFLLRFDKATVLHVAIHSENFELAHHIAETYPFLKNQQDGDGMTGLQLLACKPSAFDTEFIDNSFKRFIKIFIDSSRHVKRASSRVPIVKEIQKQTLKSESAKKLATLLIRSDASWEATEPISDESRTKLHIYRENGKEDKQVTISNGEDKQVTSSTPASPLFLATKYGCTYIVKKILEQYPQAVEHIDEEGRDILHVAIKHRRMEIYKTVTGMKNPLKRLKGKIDNNRNSLLHMVAMKAKDQKGEGDIRSPALVLRDDLLLFEDVKNICTTLATLQVNNNQMTAEQLLIKNSDQLRNDAKEWMKRTAEHCSIVAVLIATVAFAAAYTVPGGPNQQTGYPLLKNKPFFIVFVLADALSLTFSLTSVIIFLSILTSSFRLIDFQDSLHYKLLLGLTDLILSVSMMMVSFAATLILTISSGQDWTNILLYIISFFPVTVFVFSYVSLYKLLIQEFGERLNKFKTSILPKSSQTLQRPQPPSQSPTTRFKKSTTSSFV